MSHSLVPTPFLELILNESPRPEAPQAIEELAVLRQLNAHLVTHLQAIRQQNESTTQVVSTLISRENKQLK